MTNREAYERDCNELEQYREIGTVEQVRNQKHNLEMAYKIISDYEAIGTVEECREAVDKQKPRIPEFQHMLSDYVAKFKCPGCGHHFNYNCADDETFYCNDCGQAMIMEG